MSDDTDLEYALIDGTIVHVHQKATGAKGGLRLRWWKPLKGWSTRSGVPNRHRSLCRAPSGFACSSVRGVTL